MLLLLCVALGQSAAGAEKVRVLDGATFADVRFEALVDELARRDAVFFGEEHDNAAGHAFYAKLLPALQAKRPDLVLSMEMFERDVAGVLADYLRGRVSEEEFLKRSRPWPGYKDFYRPGVELAKDKKLDVIAANLPRPVARLLSQNAAPDSPHAPRRTIADKDKYWELFLDAMKGHPDPSGKPIARVELEKMSEGMFKAQCAKDDAMAEAMADYLAAHPHRHPLMVHRNGNFHSDYGLGTASRFQRRAPLAQISIISMVSAADVAKPDLSKSEKKAHFLLVVPEAPKKSAPKAPVAQKAPGKEKNAAPDPAAKPAPKYAPPQQPPSTNVKRIIGSGSPLPDARP
ncbi:MAG TPA: ChaN family lipoprotein [Planctomycetia bacterium]|nr:ChaN family lipoprotein [Planctomycetia bacterium]